MSDMEILEHMEHAAHSGHDDKEHGEHPKGKLGLYVGLTMACLGVLLAFSSALVGGQRTELIATMVEHTNTSMKYQALSTKYRVLLAQLRQLHSLEPDAKVYKKWDEESKQLAASIGAADAAKIARIIRLENAKNLNAEIPTHEDLMNFAGLVKTVENEQEKALEWAETYEPAVQAHSLAAEHYEWGQLATEIGIVMASLALLFSSRKAWYGSLLLAMATVAILAVTFVSVTAQVNRAEEEIHHAHEQFKASIGEKNGKAADDELLDSVEKDEPPLVDPSINSISTPATNSEEKGERK